jgi:uncharacterized protein YbjT (DUF2867 family)
MSDAKEVLVIGATGQQGGAVARELLPHGWRVRALTRKPEGSKARDLAAIRATVVPGDLDDPASLERALRGVYGVFSVQNTYEAGVVKEEEQGKRVVALAKQAGVQHFVYTSVASAQRNTGIPHFDNKWRIEEAVRGTGFPTCTILRPVFFMENFQSPWFKPGIDQGKLRIALLPTTHLHLIAVGDIGRYARWAFEHPAAANGRAYELAGDVRTMPEAAKILARAAGRKIEYEQLPIETVRNFSADFALMFEWFDRVGYDTDIPSLSRETGIRPLTLPGWASKAFRGGKVSPPAAASPYPETIRRSAEAGR